MKEQTAPPGIAPVRELMTSSRYFDTEAHYQIVAAAIRTACDGGGYVLVTGDPAPSGTQLARELSAHGAPRCDVGVIACRPESGFAEIVTAYAARLGIVVAETEARQHWHRIAALMRPHRGPTYMLVLEHAEQLDDAVLDELAALGERRAPVVLIASEALAQRLETPPLGRLKSAITRHLQFRDLARNEIEAFIHFQLSNAGGGGRDFFTARVVELIAAQAKGDPAAADRLTAAVLDASRGLGSGVLAGLRMRALKQADARTEGGRGAEPDGPPSARALPMSAGTEPPDMTVRREPPELRLQAADAEDLSRRADAPAAAAMQMRSEYARALDDEVEQLDVGAPSRIVRLAMLSLAILGIAVLSAGVTLYPNGPRQVWRWGQAKWADVRSTPGATRMPASADASSHASAPSPEPASPGVSPSAEPVPAAAAETAASAPLPPMQSPPVVPETAAAALPAVVEPPAPTVAETQAAASIEPTAAPAAAEPLPAAAPAPAEAPVVAKAEPSPPAPITAPATPSDPPVATADVVTLVWRGNRLLADGDIVAARRFFERAAAGGDAGAACGAGKSYDPLFLKQLGVRGVAADPAKAIAWYRKAVAAGSVEAPALLERLLAAIPS